MSEPVNPDAVDVLVRLYPDCVGTWRAVVDDRYATLAELSLIACATSADHEAARFVRERANDLRLEMTASLKGLRTALAPWLENGFGVATALALAPDDVAAVAREHLDHIGALSVMFAGPAEPPA